MKSVLQREPMIPLTGATIAYTVAGSVEALDVPTIIVNRLQVEWITVTGDEASIFPDATVRSPYSLNLRKDFTGPAPIRRDPSPRDSIRLASPPARHRSVPAAVCPARRPGAGAAPTVVARPSAGAIPVLEVGSARSAAHQARPERRPSATPGSCR